MRVGEPCACRPSYDDVRRYECLCYQTAYYLLGNETEALAAARTALLELAGDLRFPEMGEREQRERVRRSVIFHSLQIRKETVLAV